jgi:hypothetical protein
MNNYWMTNNAMQLRNGSSVTHFPDDFHIEPASMRHPASRRVEGILAISHPISR